MEEGPVVQVVQIHRVANLAGIRDAGGAEDFLAGAIGMNITADGVVMSGHRGGVHGTTLLLEDPGFELRIARAVGLDVAEGGVLIQAQGIQGHLVVAAAASRVIGMQLADGIQGGLLPEARQVKNAQGAGGAGTDGGNNLAHGI